MTLASFVAPQPRRNTFVFWQRTSSNQQAALIAELALNPGYRVLVAVPDAGSRLNPMTRNAAQFGAAEVVSGLDHEGMLRLASMPAEECVHLIEGAQHPVWDCLPVIDHWVTHRPRVLLLEEGHIQDGAPGRRQTRALRGLARLGGQLISAILVSGSHPAHQFRRLGFTQVLPFTHFIHESRSGVGSPAPGASVTEARAIRLVAERLPTDRPYPAGASVPGQAASTSHQEQRVNEPPVLGIVDGGAGARAEDAEDVTAPGTDAQHVSAPVGVRYLEGIVSYLDHPESGCPSVPWRANSGVRYRRS